MTIDERLDRLTERHEALTQTVQIIAGMQLQNEEAHRRNEEAHLKNEIMLEKNQVLLAHLMESVDGLARIAHAHEHRISDIEEGRA